MKKTFKERLKSVNILRALRLIHFDKTTIYAIVILACIGLNVLLVPVGLKADFSFGKAYTLSPATKNIIKNIKEPITLEFYVSSDLPTRLLPLSTDVVDLLNEYKSESNNIQLKTYDPTKDQNAATRAQQKGVPQLQFSQLEQGKYAVTATYFGIAVLSKKDQVVIPQATDPSRLEYNLSAAIYRLTRKDLPKVGIVGYDQSLAAMQGQDELATLRQVLGQQFSIESVSLSPKEGTETVEVNPQYKTLLVFDTGTKKFSDAEVAAFKKYINNGGKAIFFVDGVHVNNDLSSTAATHNLFSLLSGYGISLNKDLVLSASAEFVNFGNNEQSFLTPYPYWIKTGIFNGKSSHFVNLTQIVYPWVSSVKAVAKNGFTPIDLVRTPTQSWEQTKDFTLNPQQIAQPTTKQLQQFVVMAETKNNKGSQVLVIPSSRFVVEQFLGRNNDNLALVLNIVNEYASGGTLSGIRARTVGIYPLPDIPEQAKDIFKYANILVLPGILTLYGLWRLLQRKSST